MAEAREHELALAYDALRPRLVRVAYAVVGSRAEAEDVVADCWLRLVEADRREAVRDLAGWATVTVARAATDVLRSARVRREAYVGPWLPEPWLAPEAAEVADPAERVSLDESVSYALLVVLESLSPAERTAWVLHDVFGVPFDEVADAVGRSPAAVRKLAARARAHLGERRPRFEVERASHEEAVGRFLAAAGGQDLAALTAVLDPDVVLTADGGGEVNAARRPVVGADKVARFVLGIVRRSGAAQHARLVEVNGVPALALLDADDGRLDSLTVLTVDDGRVTRVDILRAPSKLAPLQRRWLGGA